MQNLEFSFIGEFIRCRHSDRNGIRVKCIRRAVMNTNIISLPMARKVNSAIKILYQCLKQKNLTQMNGWIYLKNPEQSMLCLLRSIMMDLLCTKLLYQNGTLLKWARSAI